MVIKIAGVTHDNRQAIIDKHLAVGDKVLLFLEPQNKFDENAIKIVNKSKMLLGYVPKVARERNILLKTLKDKKNISGNVISIRGLSHDIPYGVEIEISDGEYLCDLPKQKDPIKKIKGLNYIRDGLGLYLIGFGQNYMEPNTLKVESIQSNLWDRICWREYYVCSVLPSAFIGNQFLEHVELHKIDVDKNAFKDCIKLKTAVCGRIISEGSFENCSNLKVVSGGYYAIHKNAFKNCTQLTTVKNTPEHYLGPSAFENCAALIELDFDSSSFNIIPEKVFKNCTSLKIINLPETINYIAPEAFKNCSSLEEIIFDGEVFKIDKSAFSGCKSLKSITFKQNVKILAEFAFKDCVNLESVKFLKDVYTIEKDTFLNCKKLKEIIIDSNKSRLQKYLTTPKDLKIVFLRETSPVRAQQRVPSKEYFGLFDFYDDYSDYGGHEYSDVEEEPSVWMDDYVDFL